MPDEALTQPLVDAYIRGEISRRVFVRRLIGAGVALSAALSYSELLTPEWALAQQTGDDYYGGVLNPPAAVKSSQTEGPAGAPPAPVRSSLRLSKTSLAALLATGRVVVKVGASAPATGQVQAVLSPFAGASKAMKVGRRSFRLTAAGQRRVVVPLSRKGRRALRRSPGGTLTVRSVLKDANGAVDRRVVRVRLRRRAR